VPAILADTPFAEMIVVLEESNRRL
jgi:hypothetical protein